MKSKIDLRLDALAQQRSTLLTQLPSSSSSSSLPSLGHLHKNIRALLSSNLDLLFSIESTNSSVLEKIDSISKKSEKGLAFFESLKHRKHNIESLLNILSCVTELDHILPIFLHFIQEIEQNPKNASLLGFSPQNSSGDSSSSAAAAVSGPNKSQMTSSTGVPRPKPNKMIDLLKLTKSINEIFKILPSTGGYFDKEKELFESKIKPKLGDFAKKNLEEAIVKKEITMIEYCSSLLAQFGTKENLFERFLSIYLGRINEATTRVTETSESRLRTMKSFSKQYFEETSFSSKPDDSQGGKSLNEKKASLNYNFPFFQDFLDILRIVFSAIEKEADNDLIMATQENFEKFVTEVINREMDSSIKAIFACFNRYFGINIQEFLKKSSQQHLDLARNHGKSSSGPSSQEEMQELIKVSFYLSELSMVSEQYELFKVHLSDFLVSSLEKFTKTQKEASHVQMDSADELNPKRASEKAETSLVITDASKINLYVHSLSTNRAVFELLSPFTELNQGLLKLQRNYIMTSSEDFILIFFGDRESFSKLFLKYVSKLSGTASTQASPASGLRLDEWTYKRQTGVGMMEFLDEYFYLLRESCFVTLKSSNKLIICSMLNFVGETLLQEAFLKVWFSVFSRVLVQGNFHSNSIHFSSSFLPMNSGVCVLFNVLHTILQYIPKLTAALEVELQSLEMPESDTAIIRSCIGDIQTMNVSKFKELLNSQMAVLAQKFINGGLKGSLEILREIRFKDLNEETIQVYQANADQRFSFNLTKKIDSGLSQWETSLSDENYEIFLQALASEVAKCIEAIVFTQKFNLIGGFLFEQEIRAVSKYFQSKTKQGNIKANFAKLSLLSELLNIESKSDLEQYYAMGIGDLNPGEINRILKLRVDLK